MKPRTLIKFLAGCLALAAMADACAPVITIKNNTTFEVRAIVNSKGHNSMVSPSPGESSVAEGEEGPYSVTIIPSKEWLDHATATRSFLNESLAHADRLSGPELLKVIDSLKAIALKIKEFQAAGKAQSCTGQITQDGGGNVTVGTAADGSLKVVCN
jgi:hypothetical protein